MSYPTPWQGGPPQGQGGPPMLAAHADRERAVDVLKAGFAEGRLTRPEYEERVAGVYRSATYGELDALVRDLPRGPVPLPPAAYHPPVCGPPAVEPGYWPVVPQRPIDALATASLLCGLAGVLLILPAAPAVVLGHRARARIRRTGEGGTSAATAGVVLGYVVLAFWLPALVLVFGR